MNIIIRNVTRAIIPLAIAFLAGCASFSVYYDSPPTCLEGKDYTIRLNVSGEVTGVTLFFSLNGAGFKEISPEKAGSVYQYTIPARSIVQGKIEYYALILDKDGKPHETNMAQVQVLSMAEGKAREEADLLSRIRYVGDERGAVTTDMTLSWIISPNPFDAGLALYYRFEGSSDYMRKSLVNEGGRFGHVIPRDEVSEGALEYYLEAGEDHPDFGRIEITFPRNGEMRPSKIPVLGLEELGNDLADQLARGIRHAPETEVPVTKDLELSLMYTLPASKEYGLSTRESPTCTIHLLKRGSRLPEKGYPLTQVLSNIFAVQIDKRNLALGYDSYYFTLSVKSDYLGTIEVTYPKNGETNPFTYRIITVEELAEKQRAVLARNLAHVPPGPVTGLEPVTLEVRSGDTSLRLAGVLHVRKPTSDRYEDIRMTSSSQGLAGVLPVVMISGGYTLYYFTVSAAFDELGTVSVDLKQDKEPFSLTVQKEPSSTNGGEKAFLDGIIFEPVKVVEANKKLTIRIQVKKAPDKLLATLYYRVQGDKEYTGVKMSVAGINYSADMPAALMRDGKTVEYYFIFQSETFERDIMYPLGFDPLSFTVGKKPGEDDKNGRDGKDKEK